MKKPSTRTATIGEILSWASNNNIRSIGVSETLELHNHRRQQVKSSLRRIRDVARVMDLQVYKLNGRLIITRQPLTVAAKVTMVGDMPADKRGESSPELGF